VEGPAREELVLMDKPEAVNVVHTDRANGFLKIVDWCKKGKPHNSKEALLPLPR